ncbi:MAG: hypothetical protein R3242_01365 [Akkermansiaceae bacterium]|nr:hypothetical protein [Akkermansiaceae bacterium]
MKTSLLLLLPLLAISSALQAEVTDEEKKGIKAYVFGRDELKCELLNDENLSALSSARFYEVKVVRKNPSGSVSTETLRVVKDGGDYVELDWLGSTMKCDQLTRLFDKKIVIKNEEDAKSLEAALDLIYPLGTFDEEHRKIYREGNKWIFVRGDIFDNLKGFQFTVDDEGTVTSIDYRTDIKQ